MTKLSDFVKVYDVASPEACKALIDVFEESKKFRIRRSDEIKNFTELNVNDHYPEIINLCVHYAKMAFTAYLNDLPEFCPYFDFKALEEFRIKRYISSNNGGFIGGPQQFRTHVDVGDVTSCKRQLAFLFYLNDEFSGGETQFSHDYIKPKTGDILVFPPTWQYPHAGLPVTDGTKYIMSTYLHYV